MILVDNCSIKATFVMLSSSTHPSSWPQAELAFPHSERMLHGSYVIRDLLAGNSLTLSQTASPQVYLCLSAVMPHLTKPWPESWLYVVMSAEFTSSIWNKSYSTCHIYRFMSQWFCVSPQCPCTCHIPLLFCHGLEGLPPCPPDLSLRSWIQRSLHSKCSHCRPVG